MRFCFYLLLFAGKSLISSMLQTEKKNGFFQEESMILEVFDQQTGSVETFLKKWNRLKNKTISFMRPVATAPHLT